MSAAAESQSHRQRAACKYSRITVNIAEEASKTFLKAACPAEFAAATPALQHRKAKFRGPPTSQEPKSNGKQRFNEVPGRHTNGSPKTDLIASSVLKSEIPAPMAPFEAIISRFSRAEQSITYENACANVSKRILVVSPLWLKCVLLAAKRKKPFRQLKSNLLVRTAKSYT